MLTDLFCFISSFKNSAEPVVNKLIFCGPALYGEVHHLFRYTDKERILLLDNLKFAGSVRLIVEISCISSDSSYVLSRGTSYLNVSNVSYPGRIKGIEKASTLAFYWQ